MKNINISIKCYSVNKYKYNTKCKINDIGRRKGINLKDNVWILYLREKIESLKIYRLTFIVFLYHYETQVSLTIHSTDMFAPQTHFVEEFQLHNKLILTLQISWWQVDLLIISAFVYLVSLPAFGICWENIFFSFQCWLKKITFKIYRFYDNKNGCGTAVTRIMVTVKHTLKIMGNERGK